MFVLDSAPHGPPSRVFYPQRGNSSQLLLYVPSGRQPGDMADILNEGPCCSSSRDLQRVLGQFAAKRKVAGMRIRPTPRFLTRKGWLALAHGSSEFIFQPTLPSKTALFKKKKKNYYICLSSRCLLNIALLFPTKRCEVPTN